MAMYRIIELQPRELVNGQYFELAVNLHRRKHRHGLTKEYAGPPPEIWAVRLSPRIWEGGPDSAMDHWWSCATVEQYQLSCEDILEKAMEFGVPFLEDPDSTWDRWRGAS